MELKLAVPIALRISHHLLIVPYGIETIDILSEKCIPCFLLIVPYGIETYHRIAVIHVWQPFNRTLWN